VALIGAADLAPRPVQPPRYVRGYGQATPVCGRAASKDFRHRRWRRRDATVRIPHCARGRLGTDDLDNFTPTVIFSL